MRSSGRGFDDAAPDLGIVAASGLRELGDRGRGKPRESVQAIAAAHRVAKRLDERADRGLAARGRPGSRSLRAPRQPRR